MTDPVVLSFGDTIIRESDLDILQGPHWLNDSLIGFYLEYLQTTVFKDNCDVLFISPEVTQALKVSAKEDLSIFFEPLDVKNKQLILLPLNDCESIDKPGGTHWSLLVFSRPDKIVFHVDSAGCNIRQARKVICNIAQALDDNGFDYEDLKCLQQKNGYDCGIFVLYHAELIAQHFIEHKHLKNLEIVDSELVVRKRHSLLQLICSLREKNKID